MSGVCVEREREREERERGREEGGRGYSFSLDSYKATIMRNLPIEINIGNRTGLLVLTLID